MGGTHTPAMATRQRSIDRGRLRAQRLRTRFAEEVLAARLGHGLSQRHLVRITGISQEQISRIEHGKLPSLSIEQAASLAEVLGLELSLKLYPGGPPVRDVAHIRLLAAFRAKLHPTLPWGTEVPLQLPGDLRAWDAATVVAGKTIGVDAETRLHDVQALERRVALKKRDSGFDRVILVVKASRTNQSLVRALGPSLAASFPVPSDVALRALAGGRDPGADALILI